MKEKDYDKMLLKMVNNDTRDIIIKTLQDYLTQLCKEQ